MSYLIINIILSDVIADGAKCSLFYRTSDMFYTRESLTVLIMFFIVYLYIAICGGEILPTVECGSSSARLGKLIWAGFRND